MKDYKAYFIVLEQPEIVYQALTTEKTIRLWTGAKASFTAKEGTDFSLYNETINGQNLLLDSPNEIVQQWYLQEIDQAEDASLVTFKLFPHKKGTSVQLIHTNIPDTEYDQITQGWEQQFFADLQSFYKD